MADNTRLCFDASVAWAQRNDSLLVFERAAVCFLRASDVVVSDYCSVHSRDARCMM